MFIKFTSKSINYCTVSLNSSRGLPDTVDLRRFELGHFGPTGKISRHFGPIPETLRTMWSAWAYLICYNHGVNIAFTYEWKGSSLSLKQLTSNGLLIAAFIRDTGL